MKIGIFDSGMGGTTIFLAVKSKLPDAEYKYIADSKNCPYGEKSDEELQEIVVRNTEELISWGAEIIVIACNTATVRCIEFLRKKYPEVKFVGTEPAIKLAANTDTREILVLATPGTVASERAHQLADENQKENQHITLLSCPGLADAIEHTLKFDENYYSLPISDPEKAIIYQKLSEILKNYTGTPDIIVLGCTHYSLIKSEIKQFFENAKLLDSSDGVARQVASLM